MEGTIPALINSSLETKATLERLSKEFEEKQDFKNRQPYSAVEAFENLSAQFEALQKRQQEMVQSMSSMVKRITELQQNYQLLQKENADLKKTTTYLREAVKSHETSMLHVQSELKRVTDRAEHDRAITKKEVDQINKTLSNMFTVMARFEVNTEDIVTREVARDERSIGLITDMNNRLEVTESSMFGLTPVVRALCEHNLPDIVRRSIMSTGERLFQSMFPEGRVAVAFAVPTDQAVPAVQPVTAVTAEEAPGT
eukprot:2970350-Amphidinium_carterae.1